MLSLNIVLYNIWILVIRVSYIIPFMLGFPLKMSLRHRSLGEVSDA